MDMFNEEELQEIKRIWSLENCEGKSEYADSIFVLRLIKTIEKQQEKINYYVMKYENTGAIFNKQRMQSKIEEQQEEIERLKSVNLYRKNCEYREEIERLKEGINKVLKYMEDHSGTVDVPKRLTTDGLFELYRLAKKLIK